MKKLFLLIVTALFFFTANAEPVSVEKALLVGQRFVNSTFRIDRQSSDLQLVYTGVSNRGESCFYVFNVGETGFVIVSADDRFRPITGYSDEGVFATENRSPELDYYLEKIIEARTSSKAVLYEDAQQEWQSILKDGKMLSRNQGRDAFYLCQTTWNQDTPYNYYSPAASSGPGGRCYAGCVATAMSQLMKYWDYPEVGTGSHSYYSSYGHLSANFGATTYNWEHMPNAISGGSALEEIEAVALLMYHCGVSVDMMFGPSGSGAYSDDVPNAIQHYFSYSTAADHLYRYSYSLEEWKAILKEQFDLGWPVYYSGYSDTGGHAFVCDGYDDNDLFHYNWGWGGSSDGWFVIDEIDYANWASIIRNYVPAHVFDHMPLEPENFVVESLADADFSAALSWTNPTHNIHGQPLTSIDKVVVCRDGKPVYTFDNAAPGQAMSYTDHYIPTMASYSVYVVSNNAKGKVSRFNPVALGPFCNWSVEMSSSDPQGWKGAKIIVKDGMDVVISTLSLEGTSATQEFSMPMGSISFSWASSEFPVGNIHFDIKNAEGVSMSSFDGSTTDMKSGVFYSAINACQSGEKLEAPRSLTADKRDSGVMLNWQNAASTNCRFFIYRDGLLYDIVDTNNYLDSTAEDAFHSYYVTAYDGNMESDPSNSCDVQPESDNQIPTRIRYTVLSKDKIRVSWDAPRAAGVSGYRVYRRTTGETFFRVKSLSSNSFEMNIKPLASEVYDLAVTAYYSQTHSESAFGTSLVDPSLHYVEINNTVMPIRLDSDVMEEGVKLVWLTAILADQYTIYRNGSVIAEGVTDSWYLDTTAEFGQEYRYVVVASNAWLTSNPSNEIRVDWSTLNLEDQAVSANHVFVYPNPADGQVSISAKGMQRIAIYNLLGQMLMSQEVKEDNVVLDLSTFDAGTYFIRVSTESSTITEKLLKE